MARRPNVADQTAHSGNGGLSQSENLSRQVNEEVHILSGHFATAPDELIRVICECSTQECIEQIDMTLAEYERIRGEPALFAIKPGHLSPEQEQLEAENERYWTVSKKASALEHARTAPSDGRAA